MVRSEEEFLLASPYENHPMHPTRSATTLSALAGFLLLAALAPLHLPAEEKNDFSRWEKEIQAFEKKDKEQPPPANAVLFVGSSSIRLWNLAKSFPGVATINRGFGGSQTADVVHFVPRIVVKYQPRLIVFYAGDNDLAAGKTPDQVAADFQAFVQAVRKELPETKIVFLAIKPSPSRWKLFDKQNKANQLIEARCKDGKNLTYLDSVRSLLDKDGKPRAELFQKDGLHMNEEGYRLWAGLVQPYLN
jgi:lysophospholipase L1-like esterase